MSSSTIATVAVRPELSIAKTLMLYILLSFSLSSGIRPPFFIHNRSSLPPNFIPSYPVLSDRTSLHLIDYDLPIVKPFFQVFFYDNFRPVFRRISSIRFAHSISETPSPITYSSNPTSSISSISPIRYTSK